MKVWAERQKRKKVRHEIKKRKKLNQRQNIIPLKALTKTKKRRVRIEKRL